MTELTLAEARRLHLSAQGLLTTDSFGTGKAAALRALEHLGYVQIDTISVVERAHHHVLWSRVSDYRPRDLHSLMADDRHVFEYWSHAAAYLPMRDYRWSLPRMKRFSSGDWQWFEPTPEYEKLKRSIVRRIRDEGPLAARHFESPRKSEGWFDWKPAKRVLEQLFMEGRLMVSHRQGFDKIYDLRERVLPSHVETRAPTPQQHARHLIESFLRAHAFGTPSEIAYLRKSEGRLIAPEVKEGLRQGWLEQIFVKSVGEAVVLAAEFGRQRDAAATAPTESRARLVSPFDSAVIRRKRFLDLHGLDYQIECYVPEPKRRFGYFCMPVMVGDRFVGRLDAKAHRGEKTLEVIRFHHEVKDLAKPSFCEALREEVERYAAFNGCARVKGRL